MNFKTTIVLVVLLLAAGLAVLFTRDGGTDPATGGAGDTEQVARQQRLLPDVQPADVTRLTIAAADGKKTTLEKSGANWRLVEPVAAPAQAFEVDSLVRAIANLESTNTVAPDPSMGLEKPRYTIDLATSGGKSHAIGVGEKAAVGDSLYVALKGDASKAHVVPAELLAQLTKPASTYRDPKLVDMSAQQVTTLTINKPDGKIVLARSGNEWKVTEPSPMPAEKTEVDEILSALTGLRAAEFVSEDPKQAAQYQLEPPRYSAVLSAAPAPLPVGVAAPPATPDTGATAASTAPASQPAAVTVRFGRFEDVTKQNVLAMTSQAPAIAKVGATILETINKKPLELRDRRAADIDGAKVSSITITSDVAATTKPTSRPASKTQVALRRRAAPATNPAPLPTASATTAQSPATQPATAPQGGAEPTTGLATTGPSTTGPATAMASTQPATAPATAQAAATQPATKWEVVSASEGKPADDSKVDSLLSQLHPLRAQKYLEPTTQPATQPAATYVVQVTTQDAGAAAAVNHEIRLTDPGDGRPLVGSYNGLAFEADRFLIDRLSGDFLQSSKPPTDETAAPGIHPHESGPPGPTFAP